MILLIDNYDSFAHNLARYLHCLGAKTRVVRNDLLDMASVERWQPSAVVLSPGPCTPNQAGVCLELVREFHRSLPILGVCLGHQTIAQALGARIVPAPEPMHGRTSLITHEGQDLFRNAESPMQVCRYHSLVVDEASLPACLTVTATADDGTVMAVSHNDFPVFGVQFHPESILTDGGYSLLQTFLELAHVETDLPVRSINDERPISQPDRFVEPDEPVTF